MVREARPARLDQRLHVQTCQCDWLLMVANPMQQLQLQFELPEGDRFTTISGSPRIWCLPVAAGLVSSGRRSSRSGWSK
jgi:hypothetical protein